MTREGLKSQILEQISQNSSKIIETGEGIFRHPGLGFKETSTSGVVRNVLTDLGLVRVHPIITKGGDLVNVVPADVRMEIHVRGKTMESIPEANHRVNRALQAGAYAMGAEVEIEEVPGYLPRRSCPPLEKVFFDNAVELLGETGVEQGSHGSGSSDMGDLMHVMPAIHPGCGGAVGTARSEEFLIQDPDTAYVLPSKLMALTVVDLLWNDAALGRKVRDEFHPAMTKDEYFAMWDRALAPRALRAQGGS